MSNEADPATVTEQDIKDFEGRWEGCHSNPAIQKQIAANVLNICYGLNFRPRLFPAVVQNSVSVFSSSKVLSEEPLSSNVPVASSGVGDLAAPSPAVVQNSGSVFRSSKVFSEEPLSPNVPVASSGVGEHAAPSSAVVVPVASSGPNSSNQLAQHAFYPKAIILTEQYFHNG